MTTLVATTAREITFSVSDSDKRCVETRKFPAGTDVYAKVRNNGTIEIRVQGTLFKQSVYAGSLIVA
jgi:hypothetical protein